MILTKDNLIRFVREKKAVTPTEVAESFETTTMIASAALSELAKENLVKITHLKLASSPYYYDPKQSSILIELGKKHLKGYDLELFNLLYEKKILPFNSLTIQLSLAAERIKDFAKVLEIEFGGKVLKFYVWYQENLDEMKSQILEVLNNKKNINNNSDKKDIKEKKENNLINEANEVELKKFNSKTDLTKSDNDLKKIIERDKNNQNLLKENNKEFLKEKDENKNLGVEKKIDEYFLKNNFNLENKQKKEKGIFYQLSIKLSFMLLKFDSFYFFKKPTESDIIKFYTSSINPKIIFIENPPKKLMKLSESIDNLIIISL
jgi:hypothetical protein